MRIAVVGCGAVGSFYGAKLGRAGHETHFLLRSDFDFVRCHGVSIQSREGDFTVKPRCARIPEEIGVVDLVLIGLKSTANDQFARLLPPLVGPATAILTLQNGLGNEEALAQLFPSEQILGGLCFVCLNRIQPGIVHHIDHGRITLGEFRRRSEPRTHDIADVLRRAGVPSHVTDDLAQAHWEKLIWNIPFNGLGVASCAGWEALRQGRRDPNRAREACLTTDRLLEDEPWRQTVKTLMNEIITVANAIGFNIPAQEADENIARTRTMGAYQASTVIDFERGFPIELNSLFLEPLRQAQSAGISTPVLSALCQLLQQLNA